jgi:hypothetical protein
VVVREVETIRDKKTGKILYYKDKDWFIWNVLTK